MVFVPAIMGAGLVFSTATLISDVLSHGTRTVVARRARVRGELVAAGVIDTDHPPLTQAVHPVSRAVVLLVGTVATVFGLYVAIGATGNYLRAGGYTDRIAWIWAASLLVAVAAAVIAAACFTMVVRGGDAPPWVWTVLVATPLLGVEEVASDDRIRARRTRWIVIAATTIATLLTGLATWPHVVQPFDRRMADLFDAPSLSVLDEVGRVAGSTELTIVVVIALGVTTLRCTRLAWVFISTVAVSFAVTGLLRGFVGRPRPLDGPLAGRVDSFPSGHLVQITLIAVLVPLAVHELTGSRSVRNWVTIALALVVPIVAVSRINSGHHFAVDVIAGTAVGAAIGCWGQLALLVPGGHRGCSRCRTALAEERQARDDGE